MHVAQFVAHRGQAVSDRCAWIIVGAVLMSNACSIVIEMLSLWSHSQHSGGLLEHLHRLASGSGCQESF